MGFGAQSAMRPIMVTLPKVPGFKNWATRMTPLWRTRGTDEYGGFVRVCFWGKRLGRLYGGN